MGRTVLLVVFLLAALTVPVALSAGPTTDGTLSVKRGKGALVLKLKGTVIGHVNGNVQVKDQRPFDANTPQFTGCKPKLRHPKFGLSVCKGKNVGFRVTNGRFNVNVRGVAISISAVGRGPVTVDGIGDEGVADGVMSVDAAPYESLPDDPTILTLGTPPAGG
jgi:hypothetical protein